MKLLGMFFVFSLAMCLRAMENQSDQNPFEATFTRKGIIAKNETGGYLECIVTYFPDTNTYAGTIFNQDYSKDKWHSRELGHAEALRYYALLPLSPSPNQV